MLIIFSKTESRGAEITEEEWSEALASGDPWGWFDPWVSDMETDEISIADKDGKVLWEQDY